MKDNEPRENNVASFGMQVALNALWDTLPPARIVPESEIKYFSDITDSVNEILDQYRVGEIEYSGESWITKLKSKFADDLSLPISSAVDIITNEILLSKHCNKKLIRIISASGVILLMFHRVAV